MSDRIRWQRGDRPQQFVATMPEGTAEIWWKDRDVTPPGWRYRIEAGKTIAQGNAENKQDASDRANKAWPNAVREENARVSKLKAQQQLEHQIEEAWRTGKVDVMAYGLRTSEYQRLVDILNFIRGKGWLQSGVKPLADAVSAELYRRRTGG